MLKPGELVSLIYVGHEDEEVIKIGVLVEYIHEKTHPELVHHGIAGWCCLVDGELGMFLKPYWEIKSCQS